MKKNTLYASDITYEFEKTGIAGSNNGKILGDVKRDMEGTKALIQKNLDTQVIFYDKDTGEVILVYTEANLKRDIWNDNERI